MDTHGRNSSCNEVIPSLKFITARSIAITLFQINIHRRTPNELDTKLEGWLIDIKLPAGMKQQVLGNLREVSRELERWSEKHSELFESPSNATIPQLQTGIRVHRSEHLRLFYKSISWKINRLEIDDYATASRIISYDCSDWPQMQFQLACAYAMHELLKTFDRIRLKAFAKKLSGHCLYDFWFSFLTRVKGEQLFPDFGIAPHQKLSLAFQFAIINGFLNLVTFIWDYITDQQREFIGFLQWKKVCFKAKHREVMSFLCERLCTLNATGLARITWNIFYQTLQNSLQGDKECRQTEEAVRKLEFLMENCCYRLRNALLSMENFKAVTDAFTYSNSVVFVLFLDYMSPQQLQIAHKYVDRHYERRTSDVTRRQRQALILRQNTIT